MYLMVSSSFGKANVLAYHRFSGKAFQIEFVFACTFMITPGRLNTAIVSLKSFKGMVTSYCARFSYAACALAASATLLQRDC